VNSGGPHLSSHPVDERSAPATIDDGPRILLVGSTGFIGSAIAKNLAAQGLLATHFVRKEPRLPGHHDFALGDLEDVTSLLHACAGHQIVINAASYVGTDPVQQNLVNVIGASNLAQAAETTGVSRIVHVSTTSVYGGQALNGSAELTRGLVPRSTLSRSRLAGEQVMIGAGGIVLRPHLVYGDGDKFFLGPLLLAMSAIGGWIEEGRARVSTIASESLARAIVTTATSLPPDERGKVFHAAHPETSTVAELVETIVRSSSRTSTLGTFSAMQALEMLGASGVTATQIEMVAADNWVDSAALWKALGITPGKRVDMSEASRAWYRSLLAPRV